MDNQNLLNYEKIKARPISSALGAIVEEVDLRTIDQDTFDEIYHAFINYQVILFRNQECSLEEYLEFCSRFGSLVRFPSSVSTPDHLEVIRVNNDENLMPFVVWNSWYSDLSYLREPGNGSIAYCQSCEGFGGDTLFATQSLAYSSLSLTTQAILDQLKAVHQFDHQKLSNDPNKHAGQNIQPVVRTLEDIGMKALYVNPAFTREIFGMTEAESRMLLNFLFEHISQEAFTCRITWEENSLAIWDSRRVQHYDLSGFQSKNRVMYKSCIDGSRPN